ncbi:MAG: hypothetical protein K2K57_10260, partial [Oscillospiraceae bacterium]|nr:hypothetical protein [Oscillospiraceae bacterium]
PPVSSRSPQTKSHFIYTGKSQLPTNNRFSKLIHINTKPPHGVVERAKPFHDDMMKKAIAASERPIYVQKSFSEPTEKIYKNFL